MYISVQIIVYDQFYLCLLGLNTSLLFTVMNNLQNIHCNAQLNRRRGEKN